MDALQREYAARVASPSDINEHLPVLREYARHCRSAAELGVRAVVSTWALLLGLAEGGGDLLYSVDIERPPDATMAAASMARLT